MRSLTSLSIAGAVLVLAAAPTNATTIRVGKADGFASPVDLADPSPEIRAALVPYGGTNHLDQTFRIRDGRGGAPVAHTFTGLPRNVVGAVLEVRLEAGAGWTDTDGIFLSFVDRGDVDFGAAVRYARSFGPVAADPPLFPVDDAGIVQSTPWTEGQTAVLRLDLGDLPLAVGGAVSLIPDLNARGFLDVTVADETAVDYMRLELVLADDGDGPAVAALTAPDILSTTPNPVRRTASVEFALPAGGDATLRVFDVRGRGVASIKRTGLPAGRHSVDWDTRDETGRKVPAGQYFYRLEGERNSKTAELTVLR